MTMRLDKQSFFMEAGDFMIGMEVMVVHQLMIVVMELLYQEL